MMEDSKSHYIMIGGFLGAGKSTALTHLGQYLKDKGFRVGLISNDQGQKLVDTAFMRAEGFEVEEISGGCFCCRFNSLMEAAENLSKDESPDFFLAEPVGSCTDLVASVSYPLGRIYGENFSIAPLSVMVDPIRALKVLGLEKGKNFTETVLYVYRKQLEEARYIVINKTDLISDQQLQALKAKLWESYPKAKIMDCSLRQQRGLDDWFEQILSVNFDNDNDHVLDIDYSLYGEAEAELGWLNATAILESDTEIEGNEVISAIIVGIRDRLSASGHEIAHLKLTLEPEDGSGEIAVINLTSTENQPEASHELMDELSEGQLIINLRAEAPPETLKLAVEETLKKQVFKIEHLEAFKPAQPKPTHRMEIKS